MSIAPSCIRSSKTTKKASIKAIWADCLLLQLFVFLAGQEAAVKVYYNPLELEHLAWYIVQLLVNTRMWHLYTESTEDQEPQKAVLGS